MTSLWPGVVSEDGALIPSTAFAATLEGPQAMTAFQRRPLAWITEQLGIPRHTIVWSENPGYKKHRWDGTPDPLVRMMEALAAWEDVGVEAGTGTQKSHTAACVILWFLACWQGARSFTYAPKEDQLRLYIWAEIGKLWPRFQRLFPQAELTDLRIRMVPGRDDWGAWGYAVGVRAGEDSAVNAQGAHAPHLLLVTEETPGIDPAVMTAIRNTRTGAHNLQLSLGNPDNNADTLHQFCILKGVTAIRISALDHPNVVTGNPEVVPGAASPAGIRRISAADEPGTPMYERRVRGISPAEATDALIKLSWCHAAAARQKALLAKGGPRAIGVDVANSEKGDKAAKAYFVGPALEKVVTKQCPNANRLGEEVVAEAELLGLESPWHVGVDPVGVGAGTVNEMARLHFQCMRLGGAESPVSSAARSPDGALMDWVPDANRFDNLRSQMGWQLREDLRTGEMGLPDDPVLFRQLTAITYEVKGGKVVLESKDKLRKRIGGSPNEFDAIMYGNWVRPRTKKPEDTETEGDDRHPGLDYKARRRRSKKQMPDPDATVAESIRDDLRPGRYQTPRAAFSGFAGAFRMQNPFNPREEGDEDE
jgi:phage terminase large subunit